LMAHYEGIGRRVNKAGTKRGNNEVTGSEVVPVDKRGQAPRRPQSNRRSEESK
jgi:hypothetical protein